MSAMSATLLCGHMALGGGESCDNTPASRTQRTNNIFGDHMFKKLIPVIALALIAGPAFAQSTPAPASTPAPSSSSTSDTSKDMKKEHKKKHHKKTDKSGEKSDSSSTTPPK
jgi:hypothetical protein